MVNVAVGGNPVERRLHGARDDFIRSDNYGESHERRRYVQIGQRQRFAGSIGAGNYLGFTHLGFAYWWTIQNDRSHGHRIQQYRSHMVDVAIGGNFVERRLHGSCDHRIGSDHYGKSH
jgi:hypothetical protein